MPKLQQTTDALERVRERWADIVERRPSLRRDRNRQELALILLWAFGQKLVEQLAAIPGRPELAAERAAGDTRLEWAPEMALIAADGDYTRSVTQICHEVRLGHLSVDEACTRFLPEARRFFRESYLLGKAQAGWPDIPTITLVEEAELRARADAEVDFFRNLAETAQDPAKWAQVQNRAKMYGRRAWSEYQRGHIAVYPLQALLDWVLDPAADHCVDCPQIAIGGPYTRETLPTVPGAGDTACLTRCRCRLVVRGTTPVPWARNSDQRARAAVRTQQWEETKVAKREKPVVRWINSERGE